MPRRTAIPAAPAARQPAACSGRSPPIAHTGAAVAALSPAKPIGSFFPRGGARARSPPSLPPRDRRARARRAAEAGAGSFLELDQVSEFAQEGLHPPRSAVRLQARGLLVEDGGEHRLHARILLETARDLGILRAHDVVRRETQEAHLRGPIADRVER